MSRLHTGTVTRPRFESRPYQQSPGRREHIHGKIKPANDNRDWSAPWLVGAALVIGLFFALQLVRGIF